MFTSNTIGFLIKHISLLVGIVLTLKIINFVSFFLLLNFQLVKEKENLLMNKKDKVSPKFITSLNNQYDSRFNRLKSEKERLLLQEETAYEQQVQGRINEIKLNSARELNQLIQVIYLIISKLKMLFGLLMQIFDQYSPK